MGTCGGSEDDGRPRVDVEAHVEVVRSDHRGQAAHCLACGYEADLGRWGWLSAVEDGDLVVMACCPACERALPQ